MKVKAPYPCHECGGEMWAPYKSKFVGSAARKYCSRKCMRPGVAMKRRLTAAEIDVRFLSRIEPEPMSGCWLWTGEVIWNGYGHSQTTGLAHRYAWERANGPIPAGLVVDHKCRTRSCVNVDHLRVVTRTENVLVNSVSLPAKNLLKTCCPRGHEYDQTKTGANGRKYRKCSVCESALASMRWRARRELER